MESKNKVIAIIVIAVALIVGLFFYRAYNGQGIFADVIAEPVAISELTVENGDFEASQFDNFSYVDGAYQLNTEGQEVCGNCPYPGDATNFPSDLEFNLTFEEVQGSDPTDLYMDNQIQSGTTTDYPLFEEKAEYTENQGFSIYRDAGWVYLDLARPENGDLGNSTGVSGSITFPDEVKLNQESLTFVSLENPSDGHANWPTLPSDDEVTLDIENNTVEFFLGITNNDSTRDRFWINYCYTPESTYEGNVSGEIDLGSSIPITSIKVEESNFNSNTDQVWISAKLSNDRQNWVEYEEAMTRELPLQSENPVDTYCYQYIQYRVTMATTNSNQELPLSFDGLSVYGAETCNLESSEQEIIDPGDVDYANMTQCDNSSDDDGDGLVDIDDPGCSSRMDNDESDAERVCLVGDNENVTIAVDIDQHYNDLGDLSGDVYMGTDTDPVESGSSIALVADGQAVTDSGIYKYADGLSLYRGEGYIYIQNQEPQEAISGSQKETIVGTITISGSQFFSDFNIYNFEVDDYLQFNEDAKTVSFSTTVTDSDDENDTFYIYFDYNPIVGGGCQCQDGIDNDQDGYTDYPDDPSCASGLGDSEFADNQISDNSVACHDGIDNDRDGYTDYPNDSDCLSIDDDSENSPTQVCLLNPDQNLSFYVTDYTAENDEGDTDDNIYVGLEDVYTPDQEIPLVVAGQQVLDNNLLEAPLGVSILRGPGYLHVLFNNTVDEEGADQFVGKIVFSGTTITNVVNASGGSVSFTYDGFENPTDGSCDIDNQYGAQDEYNLNDDLDELEFCSATNNESDSIFIYYEYDQYIDGGCGCQDGIDNDQDSLIDYPDDPGCISPEDDNEIDTIVELISKPNEILPAIIRSGSGFWILIGVIVVIAGVSIYIVVKNDKSNVA